MPAHKLVYFDCSFLRGKDVPGSPVAKDAGCSCKVKGNNRGKGLYLEGEHKRGYWIWEDCPYHKDWIEKGEAEV